MFEREIGLIGEDNFNKINNSRVLVFGLGGVGGFVCETLVRSGIKQIGICDFDTVSISNKNRQIIALDSTIGQLKTNALAKRLKDINADVEIKIYNIKIGPTNIYQVGLDYDYFCDCIDDVDAKVAIISYACKHNIKVISSMGTGNKLDPTKFKIAPIKKSSVCPLARVMRHRLKELGLNDVMVLYSEEQIVKTTTKVVQSIAFCPSIAGILIARWVILDIIEKAS